jgi:serine/threonine protein kinase
VQTKELFARNYALRELISAGESAYVWRAYDHARAQAVVIKICRHPFDGRAIAVTRLGHPNLVAVTEHGHFDHGPFAVLEEANGVRLRRLLAGPMTRARIRVIVAQLASALAFVHQHGVVHGALTPEHVLCTPSEGFEVRLLGLGTTSNRTNAYYAAPEQLAGGRPDERSDVFSLAALALEMLTGEPIYEVRDHFERRQRPAREVQLGAPEYLRSVLAAALDRDPTRRPSLAELAFAITGEPVRRRHARGSGPITP